MKANIVVISMILVSPLACAAVYKWTDSNGEVHYTQTPPAQGKVTKLPPPPGPSSSAKDEQKHVEDMQKKMIDAEQKAQTDKVNAEKNAIEERTRAINCQRAKDKLAKLEAKDRIRKETAAGKSEILSPEEKDVEIVQTKASVEEYCSPKPVQVEAAPATQGEPQKVDQTGAAPQPQTQQMPVQQGQPVVK
jgi:hypothetical protein